MRNFLFLLVALSAIGLTGCNQASMMVRDGDRALAVSGNNCCGYRSSVLRRPMSYGLGHRPVPQRRGSRPVWQALGERITPACGRNMPCGNYYGGYNSRHGSRVIKRTVVTKRTVVVNRRTGEVVRIGQPQVVR